LQCRDRIRLDGWLPTPEADQIRAVAEGCWIGYRLVRRRIGAFDQPGGKARHGSRHHRSVRIADSHLFTRRDFKGRSLPLTPGGHLPVTGRDFKGRSLPWTPGGTILVACVPMMSSSSEPASSAWPSAASSCAVTRVCGWPSSTKSPVSVDTRLAT